ncbi:MAG: hypothetical protein HOH58_00045 [Opitutaceae bacterium]|nr:hypothetical protein [Opitutaceae bacterium]
MNENSEDAAGIVTLAPGIYHLHISGEGNSGKAIAEIYDLDSQVRSISNLANASSIGPVNGTSNLLTAGFVIEGDSPVQVLIRGIGPTLSGYGVIGALNDPSIAVFDSDQNILARNNNWGTPSFVDGAATPAEEETLISTAETVGAFALESSSLDGAVLLTLPPGAYTVQMSGEDNSSGTGLIEIYTIE